MNRFLRRLFGFASSLKLAVILILSLATILAVGTFYEAEYGTLAAQKVIYHSWFTSVEMVLLIINLTCSAIDRYPWKKHHIGFVVTHLGIITLILGSFITQEKGLDGNIILGINESANTFFIADPELHIFQSIAQKPFALLFQGPAKLTKYKLVDDDVLEVTQVFEQSSKQVTVRESKDLKKLSALKFSLQNNQVHVSEWLGLDSQIPPFYDFGPAVVTYLSGPLPPNPSPQNKIVIYHTQKSTLRFAIYSSRQIAPILDDNLTIGKDYNTGWMGLKFKAESYYPHAESEVTYTENKTVEGQNSDQVIKIKLNNTDHWVEMGTPLEVKGDHSTYLVSYTRKKFELGFNLTLKKFKMGTYGGSNLPSSYESTVLVNGQNENIISMNEPLKFNDYTIYQTSFEVNEKGEPAVSIFSVNFDPGRPIKYAGALGIVLGIGIMFYIKPRYTRKKAKVA